MTFKISCPKCHWATDDVDIITGEKDLILLIRCKKCKAEHDMKIGIISCGELLPV